MEHPQRKTWTMKHPALAKAFAVLLAVMSVILLFAGASGIEKANKDNDERLRYEKKFADRIDNYVNLSEQLENSITYEELWAELEKEIEQHDEDASQHKTDLAMYSAEKGGYTMGADMIWEMVPNPDDARRQLAIGKAQLEQNAAGVEMLRGVVDQLTPVETAISSCDALITQLDNISNMLSAVPSVPPSDGGSTDEKDSGGTTTENGNDGTTNGNGTDEKEGSGDTLASLEGPSEGSISYASRNIRVRYSAQGMDINTINAAIDGIYGGVAQLAQGLGQSVPYPSGSPMEQINMLSGTLNGIKGGYEAILQGAEAQAGMGLDDMRAAIKQYDEGVATLAAAEAGLNEAQGALENIWYQLDQLELEREDLVEMRDTLNEEAERLSKEIVKADELRELENDHTSAKLLLTSVKEVNDMVEAGGEIVPSAEKYLADYKAQTELQHKGWMASCILAIIGGIAGVLAIPAAYELIHKRFWLIVPVIVCAVCAAAAEAAYYAVGLGWWYVGMFAAIIALIHLLIVAPKEKKPAITEET